MGDGRAPAQLPSLLSAAAPLFSAPVFWTMSTTRLKGLIEKMKSRRQAETDRSRNRAALRQTDEIATKCCWITDGSDGWMDGEQSSGELINLRSRTVVSRSDCFWKMWQILESG